MSNKLKGWLSLAVAFVAALWGTHEWIGKRHLPLHLMTRAEAQTMQEQVKGAADTAKSAAQAAQETSQRLLAYIDRQELREARLTLDRLRGELQETLLWEAANGGENELSRARKADLNGRIRDSEDRVRCLLQPNGTGC